MTGALGFLEQSRLSDPHWALALSLVPMAALVLIASAWSRRRALRRFASPEVLRDIARPAGFIRVTLAAMFVLSALSAIGVALMRPQWDPSERTVTRTGRDVVFLIDVSRSMLAEDLVPNRLERVKFWVGDLISMLDGDRVGLVAFAGSAVVKCPLTLDYRFFELALHELDTQSVTRGGTLIGDAIRKSLNEVFDQTEGRFRDIILITDGEDHESYPVLAAEEAKRRGVRLIVLGVGDDGVGSTIPITDRRGRVQFLRYEGKEVRSRLDRTSLERIARASDSGVYLHVATKNIDLERVYQDLIASAPGSAIEETTVIEYQDKHQLFIGLALVMLVLEGLIGAAPKN